MTHTRYYPGANRTAQWRGNGGATMPNVDKLLLHTTESPSWPGYPTFAPTLTFHPWQPRGKRWRQHYPINGSASTLSNAGAYRTNRANVCQVEIVGYCDMVYARRYGNERWHISQIPGDALDELGELLAWLHVEWEVDLFLAKDWPAYDGGYGATRYRMSPAEFTSFSGVCGHLHAPGNNHGDPGNLDVARILAAARSKTVDPNPKPPVDPPPTEPTRLRVANWNLLHDTPAHPLRDRIDEQAHAIRGTEAHAVTLQECNYDHAAALQQKLGPTWRWHRDQTRTIMWDTRYLHDQILRAKQLASPYSPATKSVALAKLAHRNGGSLWLASTHLSANVYDGVPEDKMVLERAAQARELTRRLSTYKVLLLGGDVNSSRMDAGYPQNILSAGGFTRLADAVTVTNRQVRSFHGYADPDDDSRWIDTIAAKQRVKILRGGLVETKASDHNLLWADVEILP